MIRMYFLLGCLVVCMTGRADNCHATPDPRMAAPSPGWEDSFNAFRAAIARGDRAVSKQFVDFPILNEGNEIWDLAYHQDYQRISKLPANPQPFTAADFDQYFNDIFTKRFVRSVLSLNVEELFEKGTSKTADFKDGSITYKMLATYDADAQTLTLNLASQTKDRSEDNGMFNVIYQFDIVQGTQIRFRQVRLAG